MDIWDLSTLDIRPHHPVVLHSDQGAARVIALRLPAGEELQEHEVHERAYVVVVDGEVEVSDASSSVSGGPGLLATFAPHERHTVKALTDARFLLILAPWPGDGHPGTRD